MTLIIWFCDTVIVLIIISIVVFVFQSIVGRYRMQRFLQAEIQARRAKHEAEIRDREEEREQAARLKIEAEALAERRHITDKQQKAYEKRSKRATDIRQLKAYYLRRLDELSDDRWPGNGGTDEAARLAEIEDLGQRLKSIRAAEKAMDDARQGIEEAGAGV